MTSSASSSPSNVLLTTSEDLWRNGLLMTFGALCMSGDIRSGPSATRTAPLLSADLAGMSLLWWAGAVAMVGGSTHSTARTCPEAWRLCASAHESHVPHLVAMCIQHCLLVDCHHMCIPDGRELTLQQLLWISTLRCNCCVIVHRAVIMA